MNGRWTVTPADRDEHGNIMLDAARRAAERDATAAPLPAATAPDAPPPPTETPRPVRAIRPEDRAPAADDPPPPRARIKAAIYVCFIVAALALIIGGMRLTPAAAPARPPAPPATATPAPSPSPHRIPAYWAPDGAAAPAIAALDSHNIVGRLGTTWAQLHLSGGGVVWVRVADLTLDTKDQAALARAPDRATPTPAPTPIVIVQQAPPVQCYTIERDVYDDRGHPIGIAIGESCQSREAAEANAAAEAAKVKAAHERKRP